MSDKTAERTRRFLIGSVTCRECDGRGECYYAASAYGLCQVCRGNGVVPIWKDKE